MFPQRQEAAGRRQEQERTANLRDPPGSRCSGPCVVLGARVEHKGGHSGMIPSERATESPHPGATAQRTKMSSKLDFAILIATPEQSNRDK